MIQCYNKSCWYRHSVALTERAPRLVSYRGGRCYAKWCALRFCFSRFILRVFADVCSQNFIRDFFPGFFSQIVPRILFRIPSWMFPKLKSCFLFTVFVFLDFGSLNSPPDFSRSFFPYVFPRLFSQNSVPDFCPLDLLRVFS